MREQNEISGISRQGQLNHINFDHDALKACLLIGYKWREIGDKYDNHMGDELHDNWRAQL